MIKAILFAIVIPCLVYSQEANNLAGAHYEKGMVYYKNSETTKARAEWEKSLELCKDYDKSVGALKKLEEEKYIDDPEDSFNGIVKEFFEKGLVFYRQGENKKALAEWKQGLEINPNSKQLKDFTSKVEVKNEVETAENAKNLKSEEKKTQKEEKKKSSTTKSSTVQEKPVKSIDEKKVSELYYSGLKLYKQGKLEEALIVWKQVLKLDPESQKTKKNIEKVNNELKQGEK